jgi:hypothetical protein
MPKKPTGIVGPFIAKVTENGINGKFERIEFSGRKDAIEKQIVDMWAKATNNLWGEISEITQNTENDFDFSLKMTDGSQASLDLVEFTFSDGQSRPFEGNEMEISVYQYAKQLRDLVLKKSDHYGKASGTPIQLLVYITHWRFTPAQMCIAVAQHLLRKKNISFSRVSFIQPLDSMNGAAEILFPIQYHRDPYQGGIPQRVVDQVYWNFNSADMRLLRGSGSPGLEQRTSPKTEGN